MQGPTKAVEFRFLTDQRASSTFRPSVEEMRKQQEEEEESYLKFKFRAQPIPADHTPLCKKPLPRRASIDVKPFNLVTERRGEVMKKQTFVGLQYISKNSLVTLEIEEKKL